MSWMQFDTPVLPEGPGQVSLRKPHGDGTHEHPQDGQLVQHLAKEAESGVEIRGSNAWETGTKETWRKAC